MVDTLRQDLSFALRTLRRNPAFSLIVTLTLATGIGAATAMFSVVNGVLLRPLPVNEQERVLVAWGTQRQLDRDHVPIPVSIYRDFARASRAFGEVGAIDYHGAWEWVVREGESVSRVQGTTVSGNLFRVLGASPVLGRALEPSDDVSGAAPVLVISHGLWQRGARLALLGVAIGVAASLALLQSLGELLFEVSPYDAATLLAAAGVILLVALIACVVPARAATRVDPLVALRSGG